MADWDVISQDAAPAPATPAAPVPTTQWLPVKQEDVVPQPIKTLPNPADEASYQQWVQAHTQPDTTNGTNAPVFKTPDMGNRSVTLDPYGNGVGTDLRALWQNNSKPVPIPQLRQPTTVDDDLIDQYATPDNPHLTADSIYAKGQPATKIGAFAIDDDGNETYHDAGWQPLSTTQRIMNAATSAAGKVVDSTRSALSPTGPDTSSYQLGANDPAANTANWDKREDGSDKGNGFLGLLKRPDGRVSSEISVGVNIDGKDVDVPTMVPTLNQSELDWLMNNDVSDPSKIPKSIIQKATAYAKDRIDKGLSPFAGNGEQASRYGKFTDALDPASALDSAASEGTAALQGLGGAYHGAMEDVNLLGGAFPVLYDKAHSLFTGKDTTDAQDAWFRNTVDPLKDQDSAFDLAKNAGFSEKVAHTFGDALGVISQAVLTAGEAAPLDAAASGGDAVKAAVEHGTKAMAVPATQSAIDTGQRVYQETGDAAKALKAAQMQWLVTSAGGYTPLSMEGGLAARAATGAVSGAATGEAGRVALNTQLPADMQTPYSNENLALQGISGAVMGGLGGHGTQHGPDYVENPYPHPNDYAATLGGDTAGPGGSGGSGAAALARPDVPFESPEQQYTAYHDAWNAAGRGDLHIADPIVAKFKATAASAKDAAAQDPGNADLAKEAQRSQTAVDSLQAHVDDPFGEKAQAAKDAGKAPKSAPEKRAAQATKTDQIAQLAQDAGEIKVQAADDGHVVTVNDEPAARFDTKGAADQAAESAQQQVDDRRIDAAQRKRVSDMTPEELKQEILTHPLTDMPNRRAYDESEKLPSQVSIDANSLKWINDTGGHAAGDTLLKTIGKAIKDETPNGFHFGGDEFVVQGHDDAETQQIMNRVHQRLAGADITMRNDAGHTVHIKGIGIAHGIGKSLTEADANLRAEKSRQESAGVRAARGEPPPNATITAPGAGLPDNGDSASADTAGAKQDAVHLIHGQPVETPAVPTDEQARVGNYKKGDFDYHGQPVKIENLPGQYRSGIGSNGKPFKRRMKAAYGYFKGTKGADEDGVDVMIGNHPSDHAYVIDQLDHTGKKFDEHKVQVGVRSEEEARQQYLSHYPKKWKGLGGITRMSNDQLKRWLKVGDLGRPVDSASVPTAPRKAAPNERTDSILEFLARHARGLDAAEAKKQGIDPADMRSAHALVGIKSAFRKKGGMTFDNAAEMLHEAGYKVADDRGHYNPNTLLDRISDELAGHKHYSDQNESNVPDYDELHDGWRRPHSDAELADMSEADLSRLKDQLEANGRTANEANPEHADYIPFSRPDDFKLASPGGKAGAQEPRKVKGGIQGDLFGDDVGIKNEIEKVKKALDAKRSQGQESVETGKPDDLFSQSRQQKDITEEVKPKGGKPKRTTLKDVTETGQRDLATEADEKWSPLETADLLHRSIPELQDYIAGAKERGEHAEVAEGERVLKIHEEQARVEKEVADRRPVTASGQTLIDRLQAIEDTLGIGGKAKKATPTVQAGLEDAGEKIGGARKDRWADRGMRLADLGEMTEGEAAELVTKHAVWKPDWSKMVEGGTEPLAAAHMKVMWDKLGARPRLNTPIGRKNYVEALTALRHIMEGTTGMKQVGGLQENLRRALGDTGAYYSVSPEDTAGRDKFWSIHGGRKSVLTPYGPVRRAAEKLLSEGFPGTRVPWQRDYRVRESRDAEGNPEFRLYGNKAGQGLIHTYGSHEEAVEAAIEEYNHVKAENEAKPKEERDKDEPPERPHLDSIERIGPPTREGNVTAQKFVDDFGFRGIEFGNWAANDERQTLVNHAYDALHDLAHVLDLPPKALSLNGTMGLALGARGKSRAAAHYEPGKLVINMTKINGAGSLAHEWGHAVDHYFGEYGRSDAYTTAARGATGWYKDPTTKTLAHLRPELQEAWQNVIKAMFQRDKTKADYIRNIELDTEKQEASLVTQRARLETAETKGTPDPSFISKMKDYIAGEEKRLQYGKKRLAELRAKPDEPGTYGKTPTKYQSDALALSKGKATGYWRRPTEMWARAFESFVQDKLAAENRKSEYLVHGTDTGSLAEAGAYPTEDRPAINDAIQRLVDKLDTRVDSDKDVLFRRGGGGELAAPAPERPSRAEIDRTIRESIDKFAVKPGGIRVVDTLDTLKKDPEVGPLVRDQSPGDVIAFVHPRTRKLYFIADQIHSLDHARSLVAHEYITHFGLRAAFGKPRDAQYQAILDGVKRAMPNEVARRGEQYLGDQYDPKRLSHTNVAAEEALAYYNERYMGGQSIPERMKRWLDQIHGMIRDWLRKVMGLPAKFDDLFIRRTLNDLADFLRSGKRAGTPDGEEAPAFATPADTFYSGVGKAVDAAKREKGTGAEWEATLRNMPGVKAEEMQWLGLKDWLDGRGRVTKDEISDYVRAHQVRLADVHKFDPMDDDLRKQEASSRLNDLGFNVTTDGAGEPRITRKDGDDFMYSELPERTRDLFKIIEGTDQQATQYKQYATPGGENYRELLMTLESKNPGVYLRKPIFDKYKPRLDELYARAMDIANSDQPNWEADRQAASREWTRLQDERDTEADRVMPVPEKYRSGHWDEPNILAHVRFDDRVGPQGEKILHVHEVQSDWHQQGRRQGYANPPSAERRAEIGKRLAAIDAEMRIVEKGSGEWHALLLEQNEIKDELAENARLPPDAPFKTTWPELAMKRMLRMAAEGGYDKLSWDTGDTNAERYNMERTVDHIVYDDGVLNGSRSGEKIFAQDVPEDRLPNYLGKELAQRLLQAPKDEMGLRHLRGRDLKIGASGMRGFYDDILPKTVSKLVKKWGSSVEPLTLPQEGGAIIAQRGGSRSPSWRVIARDDAGTYLGDSHPTEEAARRWAIENGHAGELPAHSVAITPQMRDSVMEGQPMFALKQPAPPPIPASIKPSAAALGTGGGKAYDAVRRGAVRLVDNELVMSFRRLFNPKDVSPVSKDVARRTMTYFGDLAHMKQQAQEQLEHFARAVDKLGPQDQLDMIDAIETGAKQPIPGMQPVADEMRKMLDHWRDQVRGLGEGYLDNWIENYFPHFWKDDAGTASKMFASIQGRKTMRGPATFLKTRVVPTVKQGIAWGLHPATINPLIATLMKVHEMQRFISGVTMMRNYQTAKLAIFLPATKHVPAGWKEIDDPIARVSSWSEAEGGFVSRGRYIMPEDGARLINNHLGTSALRNFAPAQILRFGTNLLNSMQLSLSAFHLGFTTMDAMVSKNALGIERMLHGEPLRAIQAFAEAATPIGAALNVRRGYQLLRGYLDPAKATPEMKALVNGLISGDGRIRMDRYFLADQGESPFRGYGVGSLIDDIKLSLSAPSGKVAGVTKAIANFPVEYGTKIWNELRTMARINPKMALPFEIMGRTARATSALIMEHIVPLQKLGVFSDMAADYLRRHPNADPVEMTNAMQSIWRSVDNRLGEMVYDNKFWDRTFKDTLHLSVRAVGWNDGTIEEIGGAPFDIIKVIDKKIRTGKINGDDWGHKIPYVFGLMMTQALVGSTLQYLMTGEGPRDLKDLAFPRTGKFFKDGTAERISLPSYVKDIWEYAHAPGTTLVHKANPIFGQFADQWSGTDYFGNPLYDPDDTSTVFNWHTEDRLQHFGSESLPFAIQGQKQMLGADDPGFAGAASTAMPYIGLTPAPGTVTKPEKIADFEHHEAQKKWAEKLRFDLKKAKAAGDKEKIAAVQRQINLAKRNALEEKQEYLRGKAQAAREAKARKAAGDTSQLMDRVAPLIDGAQTRAEMASNIRNAGYPALAGLIGSLPDRLRPQVATAIQREAT